MVNKSDGFDFDPIHTERLVLTRFKSSDITEEYIKALNDNSIVGKTEARHKEWNKENIQEFICSNKLDPSCLLIGVFRKKDMIHLGNIRLLNINYIHKRAEISMLFYRKELWNNGYATESMQQVINFAFTKMGIQRICADYYSVNIASSTVFKKLGFKKEGLFKNHFSYEDRFVDSVRVALNR
tara:strand:- start:190 stop:738 length:549 start_codon:yes stop_codon:yes gene_type:complete